MKPIGFAALFVLAQIIQLGDNGQVGERFKDVPARPSPRGPNGQVSLGPFPGEIGLWLPLNGISDRVVDPDTVPFQPWSKALYLFRRGNQFEPHSRCKPSG